jgi:hypothetical protein
MEEAEYEKSEIPKWSPSKIKARALIGWLALTNFENTKKLAMSKESVDGDQIVS